MGLSSVFQIFQLAIGPSLQYTMGAFKAGQYFREVLISIPYHRNNRVLVELLGSFAHFGKENNSIEAVVCGLGGFLPGETRMSVSKFFSIIHKEGGFQLLAKTWPFNDETDIIINKKTDDIPHANTIRFHVLNDDGNVITQAEYTVSDKGIVSGPGSRDADPGSNLDQIDSLKEIEVICQKENISLLEYIYSSEELINSIPKENTFKRMLQTWKVMNASVENGLNNSGKISENQNRQAKQIFNKYLSLLPEIEFIGKENIEASVFAYGVSEESLDNQLVITAPVCETSGVFAGTLKVLQKKFRISEEKMAEALLIGGFIGSILQKRSIRLIEKHKVRLDFPIATAMAASSGLYLLDAAIGQINKATSLSLKLADSGATYDPSQLPELNMKHSALALTAINLTLIDYTRSAISLTAKTSSLISSLEL